MRQRQKIHIPEQYRHGVTLELAVDKAQQGGYKHAMALEGMKSDEDPFASERSVSLCYCSHCSLITHFKCSTIDIFP